MSRASVKDDALATKALDQWRATLNPLLRSLANPPEIPTITGSTGGNVALQNLLTALEQLGVIRDETT